MRVHNFSAGPATLPEPVLAQVREELTDWRGCGMSVMEMSHRGPQFRRIAEQAEADLRALAGIPDDYRVLFLQGGATAQFAAVPMNLLGEHGVADYVITGIWGDKALREARRLGEAREAARAERFAGVPAQQDWQVGADAAYLHLTTNETIEGVQFPADPEPVGVPIVADMSSDFLSRPIDVRRYGLIYAGAQKNVGPAGLTIVIVHESLLGRARPHTPSVLDYRLQAEAGSMLNTPPCFAWYVAGLVFRWIIDQGGLAAMAERNARKAAMLYEAIDGSALYHNPVPAPFRSRMNVPFFLRDPALETRFLAGAEAEGLVQLKGHRAIGGLRASLYNAMPEDGVRALVEYMRDFEARHG